MITGKISFGGSAVHENGTVIGVSGPSQEAVLVALREVLAQYEPPKRRMKANPFVPEWDIHGEEHDYRSRCPNEPACEENR